MSHRSHTRQSTVSGQRVVWLALVLAATASVVWLLLLGQGSEEPRATWADGYGAEQHDQEDIAGFVPVRLGAATVPIIVAALPLAARNHRRIATYVRGSATALLLLWMLFLAFGGGALYFPAVVAMGIAAVLAQSDTVPEHASG